MSHSLTDHNRRDITLTTSRVGEVVPSYYEEDNAKLITLLEKYYEFLDSDNAKSFSATIRDLHQARDISETDTIYLDELIKEIGNGLQASSFFKQPRLMAKLLASFYRAKGSLVSVEGFFRGFFNEEVTVEYPKDQIFFVGQSEIGFDSQRFIQDNELYQIFSILLKVGISTETYQTLYKKFVHPAGFHFAGQVLSVNDLDLGLSVQGLNPRDSADVDPVFSSETILGAFAQPVEMTALIDSGDTEQAYRVTLGQTINTYASLTAGGIGNLYPSITSLIDPNSFTFDDSDTAGRPDMSMAGETMDNAFYSRKLGFDVQFKFSNTHITFDNITETMDDIGNRS